MKRPMLGLSAVAATIILLSLIKWLGLDSMMDPLEWEFRSLKSADRLELISLGPAADDLNGPAIYAGSGVLGSTQITDKAVVARFVDALRVGIRDHDGSIAKCFWPRHAIRATMAGRTREWVICFQCLQIQIHVDGNKNPKLMALVSRTPEPIFDEVLKKAGVPLAPKN